MTPLTNATVLVTGATGFIGGRLAERLVVEHGARVRALVRNFGRAARLARFPIELVQGDLCSPESIDRAVAGCDYVFHCAYGSDGQDDARRVVNAQGTRHVLDAALKHRVKRVVHTSTVTVYGNTPDGPLDETAPRRQDRLRVRRQQDRGGGNRARLRRRAACRSRSCSRRSSTGRSARRSRSSRCSC